MHMLEAKPTSQRCCAAIGSGQNGPGTYRFAAIGAILLGARRYAGTVLDMALSITSRCSIETDERIELLF